jgi:hypothetical protein
MPLLPDLSTRVLERYRDAASIPPYVRELLRSNFEEALSFLISPKPWLRESEILRHRALYLELTQVVAVVLGDAISDALHGMAREAPVWLVKLLLNWHRDHSVVVTQNYDTLVEGVAGEITIPEGSENHLMAVQSLYPPFLTDAGNRSGTIIFGGPGPKTFELLKLHGSSNWYFSGLSSARGEPIYYIPPPGPIATWNGVNPEESQSRLAAVADKYPLIIPPVIDKASLLTHETIQSLWFRAGEALYQAREVTFIGYSLPMSDLVMRHFLASRLNLAATINVVDVNERMGDHYCGVLRIDPARVRTFSGPECVNAYVERLVREA